MIITVDNLNAPELSPFSQLTNAQLSRTGESGVFVAESPTVIGYALNAGIRPVSLLMQKEHIEGAGAEIIRQCGEIPVYTAENDVLARLTGFELTRGILCAMERPVPLTTHEAIKNARRIVVLENVTDATNIGSIFRCAAGLGIDAVLLAPDCCDPLHRRAVRVSMGGVFLIGWAFCDTWYSSGVDGLRKAGFTTFAAALRDDALDVGAGNLGKADKAALILGSERYGLSDKTIENCDFAVKIPMHNGFDSLNVANAAAILMYESRRTRE